MVRLLLTNGRVIEIPKAQSAVVKKDSLLCQDDTAAVVYQLPKTRVSAYGDQDTLIPEDRSNMFLEP